MAEKQKYSTRRKIFRAERKFLRSDEKYFESFRTRSKLWTKKKMSQSKHFSSRERKENKKQFGTREWNNSNDQTNMNAMMIDGMSQE